MQYWITLGVLLLQIFLHLGGVRGLNEHKITTYMVLNMITVGFTDSLDLNHMGATGFVHLSKQTWKRLSDDSGKLLITVLALCAGKEKMLQTT